MKPNTSPRPILRLRSLTAVNRPYCLVTPSILIIGPSCSRYSTSVSNLFSTSQVNHKHLTTTALNRALVTESRLFAFPETNHYRTVQTCNQVRYCGAA